MMLLFRDREQNYLLALSVSSMLRITFLLIVTFTDLFSFKLQVLFGSSSLDGGSSPMVKPKGDKQVEYLDLDLDSGKSTPPRKVNKTD